MRKLKYTCMYLSKTLFALLLFLPKIAFTQCCTSDGRPTTVAYGFESTFTPNEGFPNATLSPTNNAKAYTGNGNAVGMSGWNISSGAGAKLIRDASRATEGTDFVYVAFKAADPDSYCIENGTNLSTSSTCTAGKYVVGKRYVISADYVVFNENIPKGGTGSASPLFDYYTSSYSSLQGYVNGALAVNDTAVNWANVKTSWKQVSAVLTVTNAMKRIAFSVKNSSSNRATAGILYDNTSFEQLSITASGVSTVTCNGAANARVFTLNPASNYGGVPNLKYKVTAPSGYTIAPTTGIYGQTTTFTLTKTAGSAIGTGNLTITIADDVNTNCSITQIISDPSPCTSPCTQPSAIALAKTAATCTNGTADNNGKITFTTVTGADKYFINNGTTSTGTYATATAIPTSGTDIQTNIPNVGATYTIRFYNGDNTCYNDETLTIAAVTCTVTCAIDIISSSKGVCRDNGAGQQVYDLTLTVSWSNPPSGEPIIVTSDAGGSETIDPSSISSPQTVTLVDLPGDGQAVEATATFLATTTCIDTIKYNAPNCICVLPTAGTNIPTAGTCTGTTSNDDAKVDFTGITNADKIEKSEGATYTGAAYASATGTVTGGNASFTGLKHNMQYTFRLWNGANTCFTDVTITTPTKTCAISCPPKVCSPIKATKL